MAERTRGVAKRHQSADLGESSIGEREESTAEKESTRLLPPTVAGQEENNAEMVPESGVSVANDERQEQQKIQELKDFLCRFNAIFDGTTSTKLEKKKGFETLLKGDNVNLKNIYVQKAFVKMLNDIDQYEEFLKLFIERFAAYNERILIKYLPRDDTKKEKKIQKKENIQKKEKEKEQSTMRDLDAPLHCAVRQLNKDFIKWLLEQNKTEVNLRNKQKETALAILCQKYDCVSKLKTRLEDIEKERETADKMQQIWLDDEKIEVSAQKEELEKKMNITTILELIKMLLDKKADFNIYMNDRALPFDFLRKYYEEKVLDEIIKKASAESSVAMTEISPKQVNASAEDKKKLEKRIVQFYKETKDMKVRVTEELLEIFIRFNDLEKFKHYWKDFTVTSDNVKKVITQLLHVAAKLNYTPYVDHIIKKASTEIFKLEENKATETQEPTRSVTSERNHSFWCCFKCCQKRQSEAIDLPVITPNSQDKYETISERQHTSAGRRNQKNPSSSEGFDSQTQGETFKQEKHETENSEDTRAGTLKKLSMNAEGSFKENPFATEGAEPQTQSRTSKLQVTDPHTERATSNPEDTVPQTQSETIKSQDNQPNSQDNHELTTPGKPTSDEQHCRWCCFECCQKRHNPEPTHMKKTHTVKEKKLAHHAELKGLLKTVCENGNNALLKLFLFKINDRKLLHEHPLLILTIQKMSKVKEDEEIKYFQDCATTLIENHGKIRMQDTDPNKNTALHLALQHENYKIASLLLKEGHGLMGLMNRQNLTPIEYGTTEFWNNYLDNCITKDKTELRFNVGFLGLAEGSTYVKPSKASNVSKSHFKFVKLVAEMSETHNSKYRFTRTVNDMTALRLISQSTDRKEFLMHPVIIAFIIMKWKRLLHWHILNLLLTTITMGTFIAYTLMPCPSEGLTYRVIPGVGAFIILVREIMQWCLLGSSYFRLENVVDIINVVFIFKVVECACERDGWCEAVSSFSSFVFVSLALQATFLLGALWNSLSITLYMFKTVSSSFFYSFLSFSPVIVAFICSFYRMYNEPSGISVRNGTESNSSEENFNNFHSTWDAAIKTLVMTTGEFEAASLHYDGGKWLLFVAFLFIAPIVILNLINGLAVSDITDIRKESEFISVYKKVRMLERYERAIVEARSTMSGFLQCLFCEPLFPSPFFEMYESIIYVIVNKNNKLAIKSKKKGKSTKEANKNKASNNKNPPVIPETKNDPSMSNNNERDEESTLTDKTSNENRVSNGTTGNVTPAFNNEKDVVRRPQESNNDRSTSNNNDTGNDPNDLQLISVFPWLPSFCLKYYIGTRWFQWTLYSSLDQSYVNKAKTIERSQSKNNSVRGTNEPADTEQTDKPTSVNKTAKNQHKTPNLFSSATGPSVPDSRDKQAEMLQEQVRSIIAMLTDIQQQLAGNHVTQAEPTAGTSKISK